MTGPEESESGAGLGPVASATESLAATRVAGVSVEPAPDPPAPDPRVLVEEIVQILAETAPPDFTAVRAVFSMAGGKEIVDVVADTPDGVVAVPVALGALERARTHRELTVGEEGPWLRLLLDVDSDGGLQVGFDYGDTMIPAEHLLPGEAYLVDFERYPHAHVALWLMAHMADEGQQIRTAAQAADADNDDGVDTGAAPRCVDGEIAPLPELWSRMAALASVYRGWDAPVGPRADAAFCLHRGDGGGCTLARLPGGRAVLSGGADDSALLTAAYRGEVAFPELYRGAPRWVHNLYLDPRVGAGLLAFCYWWDGRHWYRTDIAETPEQWSAVDEIASAMPDVSTAASTADAIVAALGLAGVAATDEIASAAGEFVRAAEAGVASPQYLGRLFPDGAPAGFDVAEALAQLDAAGVLLPAHAPLDEEAAKQLVAEYCRANQVDTGDNSLDRLAATRMDAGWLFFVPVAEGKAEGEMATDQPAFLVADDGVVETATSEQPGEAAFAFTTRYAARLRSILT